MASFLITFLDRRKTVNHIKHILFRYQVKLNCLIKVEIYLLFEFPVGRVRGYRKFLNYEFFA